MMGVGLRRETQVYVPARGSVAKSAVCKARPSTTLIHTVGEGADLVREGATYR